MTPLFLLACVLAEGPPSPKGSGAAASIQPPAHAAQAPAKRGEFIVGTPAPVNHVQDTPKATSPALQVVLWGDPHAHSGLSADGCESPDSDCAAEVAGAPGANMPYRAADNGLDWFALTDHVEFETYQDQTTGEELSIWEEMLGMANMAQDQAGLTMYPGYEWRDCSANGTQHRTVLFESPNACPELRPPACSKAKRPKQGFGLEAYLRREDLGRTSAADLVEHLRIQAEQPDCQTRWVSFAHHSAYARPGAVNWQQAADRIDNEVLIEIFSEHGSSECVNLDQPGCDFYVDEDLYQRSGSAQAALQAGQIIGFVGGTDSHDANPGSTQDGPGPVAGVLASDNNASAVLFQSAPGGVTAVLLPPGQSPYAEAVFDSLLARHTLASTVVLDGVELWVEDPLGRAYLPGDLLPVGSYRLHLSLPYQGQVVLVDAHGETEEVDRWFTVQHGRPRYLRIDLEIDGQQERIWASPFYPI